MSKSKVLFNAHLFALVTFLILSASNIQAQNVKKAFKLVEKGKYYDARTIFAQVSESNPAYSLAQYGLALTYYRSYIIFYIPIENICFHHLNQAEKHYNQLNEKTYLKLYNGMFSKNEIQQLRSQIDDKIISFFVIEMRTSSCEKKENIFGKLFNYKDKEYIPKELYQRLSDINERIIYDDCINGKDDEKLINFIIDYPNSKYKNEILSTLNSRVISNDKSYLNENYAKLLNSKHINASEIESLKNNLYEKIVSEFYKKPNDNLFDHFKRLFPERKTLNWYKDLEYFNNEKKSILPQQIFENSKYVVRRSEDKYSIEVIHPLTCKVIKRRKFDGEVLGYVLFKNNDAIVVVNNSEAYIYDIPNLNLINRINTIDFKYRGSVYDATRYNFITTSKNNDGTYFLIYNFASKELRKIYATNCKIEYLILSPNGVRVAGKMSECSDVARRLKYINVLTGQVYSCDIDKNLEYAQIKFLTDEIFSVGIKKNWYDDNYATLNYYKVTDGKEVSKPMEIKTINNSYDGDIMSIKERVEKYSNEQLKNWMKKGTYEKSSDYSLRCSPENIQLKANEYMQTEFTRIVSTYFDWAQRKSTYDADNETIKLIIDRFEPIYFKVPITEARSFESNLQSIKFYNPIYVLTGINSISFSSLIIENPLNGKRYRYSQGDNVEYSNIRLNIDMTNPYMKPSEKNEVKESTKVIKVENY